MPKCVAMSYSDEACSRGTGGGDAVFRHDDLVAEEESIVHGRAHADIGDHAAHDHGVEPQIAQRQIQIGVEKRRVTPLDDVDIIRTRIEIVDHLRTPAAFDAMGRALRELAVAPHVLAMRVGDEDDRRAGLARRLDELTLRGYQHLVARQHHGTARFAKVVQHVDHQNAGRARIDAACMLELVGGKNIDCHDRHLTCLIRCS